MHILVIDLLLLDVEYLALHDQSFVEETSEEIQFRLLLQTDLFYLDTVVFSVGWLHYQTDALQSTTVYMFGVIHVFVFERLEVLSSGLAGHSTFEFADEHVARVFGLGVDAGDLRITKTHVDGFFGRELLAFRGVAQEVGLGRVHRLVADVQVVHFLPRTFYCYLSCYEVLQGHCRVARQSVGVGVPGVTIQGYL